MNPPRDDSASFGESWTFETLKTHLEALRDADNKRVDQRFTDSNTAVTTAINAAKTAVDAALSAAKEAVTKAEMASEKRFESVNEFRSTLGDQQRTFIPRAEADLRMGTIEEALKGLIVANVARSNQRTGMENLWAYIGMAIGIGFGLWGLLKP